MTGEPARPAPATAAAGAGAWRVALGLFTIIPVTGAAELTRERAVRAVRWLPAVGAAVAVPAAALLVAAEAGGHSGARRLLAAGLAIAALAVLTGGLHLDGLADTADGIASRRPRAEALAIMRRPEVGAFGVATLVLALLLQAAALASAPPGMGGGVALVVAAMSGRVAVVLAAGPAWPAARPDGLGALVAGAIGTGGRAAWIAGLLVTAGSAGMAAGDLQFAARCLLAAVMGLLAATAVAALARRRLGGMTGDVHGALIETATLAALLVVALTG